MPLSPNTIAALEADLADRKRRLADYATVKREHDELEAFLARNRNGSAQHEGPQQQQWRQVGKRGPRPDSKSTKALEAAKLYLSTQSGRVSTFLLTRAAQPDDLKAGLTTENFRTLLQRHGDRVGIVYDSAAAVRLTEQDPGGNPGPA